MSVLDYRRLGKQRVECLQIINILENKSKGRGFYSHPAVKMWMGYTDALKEYTNICIDEWISRGYKNNMVKYELSENYEYPWWLGNEIFHKAMRSRLLVKDFKFYSEKFEICDINFNEGKYLWPINESKTFKII
jgi:hypothetical protein